MGGGDPERTFVAAGQPLADFLQVLGFKQDALGDVESLASGVGEAQQAFAAANEALDAELVLEILNVLADARLGCCESMRNLR
jgi:hypothetical protein